MTNLNYRKHSTTNLPPSANELKAALKLESTRIWKSRSKKKKQKGKNELKHLLEELILRKSLSRSQKPGKSALKRKIFPCCR